MHNPPVTKMNDKVAFIAMIGKFTNYVTIIAEHSDDMMEDGRATAACPDLGTERLPALCHFVSLEGFQDKIEARSSPSGYTGS